MQQNTDSRIYDAIELISLERDAIRSAIIAEVDYYKINAARVPFSFRTVYETHLPAFAAKLVIGCIQNEINLNPEETMILQETLIKSNPEIITFFIK